jgi:hypothetical protein
MSQVQRLVMDKDALGEYSENAYKLASGLLSWNAVVDRVDDLIAGTLRPIS